MYYVLVGGLMFPGMTFYFEKPVYHGPFDICTAEELARQLSGVIMEAK